MALHGISWLLAHPPRLVWGRIRRSCLMQRWMHPHAANSSGALQRTWLDRPGELSAGRTIEHSRGGKRISSGSYLS
ncbi:hypothetical protein K402DRAFT_387875, partial [Aulographum hederae CBS 113979]